MARILIVDDEKFMRMTLSNMRTKAGHEIVGEGENGKDAIRLYRELQPDLVTLDITMPEMNGIDAVKRNKKKGISSSSCYYVLCNGTAKNGCRSN